MTVSSSPPAPRSTLLGAWSRHGAATLVPVATFHLAALATLAWSETGLERMAIFAAAWGLLNFLWLVVLCRPGLSAALSRVFRQTGSAYSHSAMARVGI